MENANVKYLIGDVFDRMAELDDSSVDLILTSPPFLALRSYLPADHPDKDKEIGSEATPAEYIDVLLKLTAEWRRLLTPHGSLCVELGDTFSGKSGFDSIAPDLMRIRSDTGRLRKGYRTLEPYELGGDKTGKGWPLAKSLTLIPEAYRFALAYGINPHTGQPSPAGQWRIRNVVRWVRPNPPVGALGDKFRPATSELVVACTSKDRYFDLDAVREPLKNPESEGASRVGGTKFQGTPGDGLSGGGETGMARYEVNRSNPAGAPPLDWWKINPKGYAGAHYAVWPSELCVKPIKAMSPKEVCRECGEPRRRMLKSTDGQQPRLAAHIRNKRMEAGISSDQINERFGFKEIAKNWERTDEWGAAIPSVKVWSELKAWLNLSDEFDAVISRHSRRTLWSAGGYEVEESERVLGDFQGSGSAGKVDGGITAQYETLGWSDCGHNNYRPGLVLDPFAGTGTTLAVAHGHGRDAIGIDIDEASAELARERVGPLFLEVVASA